ncbi:glycosyltransferase family 2 protein [Hyphomicrobium facile]|uniref:Glycosyltransferase involved in cell wall bisynthesis n=1 Tax=Hyphomicrobium facile TaxID=51670 RepID=A0A1I7MUT8_9HYPH|nr:glycosyltransferase family A protein [Hyphomicrobium facile]SFV26164.1 Glycosyltransferase involved in cell wall bisynthesis [Hyphomicrobium facile]
MTAPIVSIIIPVFNGERHLGEALASLEEEPGFQLDIVIVDDGSTDRSLDIVSEISRRDQRLRIIRGPHRGVAAARNVGVQAAEGEFVTFLDCDDVCPRGRIARQLGKLLANPEVAYVVGQTLLFEQLDDAQCPWPGSRSVSMLLPTLHCALFRRGVFSQFGLFDEELAFSEDLDFFFRLAEHDKQALVEAEIASLYRRHDGNMTRNGRAIRTSTLQVLNKSIARRRAMGRRKPLDLFFVQHQEAETLFGRPPSDDARDRSEAGTQ